MAYIGEAAELRKAYAGEPAGPAQPPRQTRLDQLAGANEENLQNAARTLSKLRAVRERLVGPVPECGESAGKSVVRSGHIGRLEDQACDLYKIYKAIDECADSLLGL